MSDIHHDSADTTRFAEAAGHLRSSVGSLVRTVRADDRMPPVTAAVMGLLDRYGPMTTAELAARRLVRHQTMAVTVAELLRHGHVSSSPHSVDGRKKVLSLTPSGRVALTDDRNRREARLAEAIGLLSPDEVQKLLDGLVVIDRLNQLVASNSGHNQPGEFVTGDW